MTAVLGPEAKAIGHFLALCPEAAADSPQHDVLIERLETFVRAGRGSLARATVAPGWLQFNVRQPELTRALCRALEAALAHDDILGYFFMRKPPGLRLRVECEPESLADVRYRVTEAIEAGAWTTPAVLPYEPEVALFGGDVAMALVHEAFTAESRLLVRVGMVDGRLSAGTATAVSMACLAHLFHAAGIVGREALGVWRRVEALGRTAIRQPLTEDSLAKLRSVVLQTWEERTPACALPPEFAGPLDDAYTSLDDIGRRLGTAYGRGHIETGLRELAAWVTIFSWNRAGIAGRLQRLLVGVLLEHR